MANPIFWLLILGIIFFVVITIENRKNHSITPMSVSPKGKTTTLNVEQNNFQHDTPEHMVAENKVEELFCALRDEKYTLKNFIENDFLNLDFVMVSSEQPKVSADMKVDGPLTVYNFYREDGNYMALYTQPQRAALPIIPSEERQYAFTINCKSIIEMISGTCGVVINGGWDTEVVIKKGLIENLGNQVAELKKKFLKEQEIINSLSFHFTDKDLVDCTINDIDSIEKAIESSEITSGNFNTGFITNSLPHMSCFVLSKAELKKLGETYSNSLSDMLQLADQNNQIVVPIFSSKESAKAFQRNVPEEFSCITKFPAKTFLETLPRGFGMVVDPGGKITVPIPDSLLNMQSHFSKHLQHRLTSELKKQ